MRRAGVVMAQGTRVGGAPLSQVPPPDDITLPHANHPQKIAVGSSLISVRTADRSAVGSSSS
jgi:hypothetical protein